jgi:hypothetical protein
MNPRRRLALRLKSRATKALITEAENAEMTTEEDAPAKIIPSYDGKAETVIAETKTEATTTVKVQASPSTAKAQTSPSIKTKTAKTTKAKKATPAPKTRKTKTTKKTS